MRRPIIALCALSALLRPAEVAAQRLVSLALGGGVSIPQGDLSNGTNTGWNALGSIVLSTPMQPLGLRADVAYNQFAFNASTQRALGGTGNQREKDHHVNYRRNDVFRVFRHGVLSQTLLPMPVDQI